MVEARNVLLVDNDPASLRLMARYLTLLSQPSICTGDPRTALTEIENNPMVGLLWTDLYMPGMNGRELASQARILRPEMPIILATSAILSELDEMGIYSDGVDLIVDKCVIADRQTVYTTLRLAFANRLACLDEYDSIRG